MTDERFDLASRLIDEAEILLNIGEERLQEQSIPNVAETPEIFYTNRDPDRKDAGFMITRNIDITRFYSFAYTDAFTSYNLYIEYDDGKILGMFYGEYMLIRNYQLIDIAGNTQLGYSCNQTRATHLQMLPMDTLMRWEEITLGMSKEDGDTFDLMARDLCSVQPTEMSPIKIKDMYNLFSPLIRYAIDQYTDE